MLVYQRVCHTTQCTVESHNLCESPFTNQWLWGWGVEPSGRWLLDPNLEVQRSGCNPCRGCSSPMAHKTTTTSRQIFHSPTITRKWEFCQSEMVMFMLQNV